MRRKQPGVILVGGHARKRSESHAIPQMRRPSFESRSKRPRSAIRESGHHVRVWHIASFRCPAEFCRYRGIADMGPVNSCDLPDGLSRNFCVQLPREKFSAFAVGQITFTNSSVSPHKRGGSRSSRTRGGMRWTQVALLTRALCLRTAKSCGPDAPTLASSS
jgi:hypothetical protein